MVKRREFIALSAVGLTAATIGNRAWGSNRDSIDNRDIVLKFRADGTFKVLQLTDTHISLSSDTTEKTLKTINSVLDKERPDLVVLTGDIITDPEVAKAWHTIVTPMIEREIPWAVTFGNHDHEQGVDNRGIMKILQTLPYNLSQNGDKSLPGSGNYILKIQSHDLTKDAASLYLFDSHAYPTEDIGHYDWIKNSQIEWYRDRSRAMAIENNNTPLPSLAFFHIPLPEYDQVVDGEGFIGEKREPGSCSSPKINSGLYCSMVEQKDMMGMFVGHDHDNNYAGLLNNICLAYGQVSGYGGYGTMERGARVIELVEGKFAFNSWITTPSKSNQYKFNFPSGIPHSLEGVTLLPAVTPKLTSQGVNYSYFEGKYKKVKEIKSSDLVEKGVTNNFTLSPAKRDDYYGLKFTAYIKVPESEIYRFHTQSDDGSVLYIDDKLVVDNDGSHSVERAEGDIALEKGYHKIEVHYIESYMGQTLSVELSSISHRRSLIPDTMLFI